MTEEIEEDYRNIYICRFCQKNFESDEVQDHCHLTGRCRGPANNECNNFIIQD